MIRRVGPAEALARMGEGYVYLDVRSVPEFEAGHPAGAFNVPWAHPGPGGMTPNDDFVRVVLRRFGASARLVVGCQAGNRSMRAAEALIAAGVTDLYEQRAGWGGQRDPFGKLIEAGWERAGLPTETGSPAGRGWADLEAA